jgi:transposase
MPWKVSSEMDERLRFIARLLEGEAMTDLCVEFGISRKTGYKIYDRYKHSGAEALNDRSRRPYRYANQLPPQVVSQIVGLKHDKPHWGARKIRELLLRRLPSEIKVPSHSTIHAVLDRSGLVKRMGRKRNKAQASRLGPTPMTCGAPTSRASSLSVTSAIAIPSPSQIMLHATS